MTKNFHREAVFYVDGVLTQQRDYALVNLNLEGLYEGFGHAVRDRKDKSNPEIGAKLATARALHNLADKIEREAQGLVTNADNEKKHKQLLKAAKINKTKTKASKTVKSGSKKAKTKV